MNIFDRLMNLDRRWVYLFLLVVCLISYAIPFEMPIRTVDEVETIYNFVEELKEDDVILLAIDYDPNSLAELHPMTYAIVEHCWRKKVKIIFTALSTNGPGMADQAIRDISDSLLVDKTYNGVSFEGREIVSGEDYVFLGYKPYFQLVILAMGQDFRLPFPTDYYGMPLDSLPMMAGILNYNQLAGVIDIGGSNVTDAWVTYGQSSFGFKLALGTTGVQTAQFYPYLGSGQIFGIMGGLLGAAQYELLADNIGMATDGMRVQLYAHMVIILFIIMGNVGFLMDRYRRKREGR